LKRALKKGEKAVLENTPSDDAPVEQHNNVVHHSLVNRRVSTKAAMIGLAISMGATSLLVTRQSDQALAAEPVGNQNTASTIPVASDTEVKFAPTKSQESRVSSVSLPENHAIVEPTAISQMSGLGAKWQVAAIRMPVQVSSPVVVPSNIQVAREQIIPSETDLQRSSNSVADGQNTSNTFQPQIVGAGIDPEVNAQLKAQQEFALNNLQQKSNRLRRSLTQLRSGETKNFATGLAQSVTVAQTLPQTSISKTATEHSGTLTDASRRARLLAKLKQRSVDKVATLIGTTPAVVAPSAPTAYEVKPGDPQADIVSNYGTAVSNLVRANSLTHPNQLQINQKLTIPTENHSNDIQTTVGNNASAVGSSSNAKVANNTNITVWTPTPANAQIQPITEPTLANRSNAVTPVQWEKVPIAASANGMGGDSPIPQAIAEQTDAARKTKSTENPRLRSLEAEIERLREKYRAQQSGNPLASEVSQTGDSSRQIPVSSANNQAVVIPVSPANNQTGSIPTYRPNQAVSIPVPRPTEFNYNYSNQPVKSHVRATRFRDDEPINPEFVQNRSPRVVTPPGSVDASQSLGNLRGTTVSPSLPPLAAVDRYLPRPVDETTTIASGYIWPAKGVLTSGFGMRWGRMHKGIDVANSTGTPVYASADGVIEKAGWNNGGYGNLVDVRHADGSMTRYGHNSKILVRVGQPVHQGETIALMGSTGFSTGPHSHFEVHPSGKGAVNPIAFLPRL